MITYYCIVKYIGGDILYSTGIIIGGLTELTISFEKAAKYVNKSDAEVERINLQNYSDGWKVEEHSPILDYKIKENHNIKENVKLT